MTEIAPTPGWWLASDGRWYPPEAAQGNAAGGTSPTPPAGWWLASDGRWYPPEAAQGNAAGGTSPTPPQNIPALPVQPPPEDFYAAPATASKPFWRITPEEDDTLVPGNARPGWEHTIGSGERKGLRTERSAGNYFVRSLIMAAIYCGFLAEVLVDPHQWWLLIGAPILIGFRYIFPSKRGPGLLAEVRRRVGGAGIVIGWARESRSGVALLRASAVLALAGFICGMIGNAIFWDSQITGMMGGGSGGSKSPLAPITQLLHPSTTTSIPGANPGQNQIDQYEQQSRQQQNTIDSLLGGGG